MKAAIYIDMYGCPNRCRHCWLGHTNNPRVPVDDIVWIAEQFLHCKQGDKPFFSELDFYTWYREPDYNQNYRELRNLEKMLSTGSAPRYEYASIWRMARDPLYAPWLKEIGMETVQVTMFGTQKTTDLFYGRTGAYRDIIKSFDIMLENGIAPKLQIFPFTENIDEINDLIKNLRDIKLNERVKKLGREFVCFINMFSPTGAGYDLLDIGLRKSDIELLPDILIQKTLRYFGADSIDTLWQTEAELLRDLLHDDKPLRDESVFPAFMIDGHYDVYPDCGEPTRWWKLGNVVKDGVDSIIRTYLDRDNPGLKMNFVEPVRYFAAKYGDKNSDRLWSKNGLVHKWMRMEGMKVHTNAIGMIA